LDEEDDFFDDDDEGAEFDDVNGVGRGGEEEFFGVLFNDESLSSFTAVILLIFIFC